MREVRQALLPTPDLLPGLPQGRKDCRAQVYRVRHRRHVHRDPHRSRAVFDAHPVRARDRETRRRPADHDADCHGPGKGEDRDEGQERVPQDRHRWRERNHPLWYEVCAGGVRILFYCYFHLMITCRDNFLEDLFFVWQRLHFSGFLGFYFERTF